jgi:hypothetical protein
VEHSVSTLYSTPYGYSKSRPETNSVRAWYEAIPYQNPSESRSNDKRRIDQNPAHAVANPGSDAIRFQFSNLSSQISQAESIHSFGGISRDFISGGCILLLRLLGVHSYFILKGAWFPSQEMRESDLGPDHAEPESTIQKIRSVHTVQDRNANIGFRRFAATGRERSNDDDPAIIKRWAWNG